MAANTEIDASPLDTIKLAFAAVLIVAGVVAFYYFSEESQLYRVLGLLAVAGISTGIALTTGKGRDLWAFLQESRTEVRKMVWPSRTETVQTTLVVFIVVILIGIFLWVLDMFLSWAIRFIIG